MNNLQPTIIDMEEDEIIRRDMGELELCGAMGYIHSLARECEMEMHGEAYTTYNDVDSATYYCNKYLEITEGGYRILVDNALMLLDSVFMLEGNTTDLWGYAYYPDDNEDEEHQLFLIRI